MKVYESIGVSKLDREERKMLLERGVHFLRIRTSDGDSMKGPFCQYAVRRMCPVDNLDEIKCHVDNCENCLDYQIKKQEEELLSEDAPSNPLRDTVIMSAEDVVRTRRVSGKRDNYESFEERVNSGEPIERIFKYSRFTR